MMKINFNVTGAQRKTLVDAISQELNTTTKYLGAPTFAYEVGGYHIDKNGAVTGKDNLDLEDALHQKGFDAKEREYDEPETYESGLSGMGAIDEYPDIDQHHPGQYTNPNAPITETMRRQLDEAPSFEDLQMDEREELGLGRSRRENFQGENGMQPSDVPEADESNQLVIEVPLTGFTPEKLDNLSKLVNAKGSLLKAALGVEDLPIQQTGETLRFPWFSSELGGDTVNAYATLIQKICETAKEKHRVTAKERDMENQKYAMRCWLLSLGFIGDEYKTARKILLKNMDGNSSYKSDAKKTTEVHDDVSE